MQNWCGTLLLAAMRVQAASQLSTSSPLAQAYAAEEKLNLHRNSPYICQANQMNGVRLHGFWTWCGKSSMGPSTWIRAAEPLVQAKDCYVQHTGGLQQQWAGKVFVNPPFGKVAGQSQQGLFLRKGVDEFHKGHASEVMFLLKAAVGCQWLRCAMNFPHAWMHDLIAFHASQPSLSLLEEQAQVAPLAANPHGSLMVYLGPNVQKFVDVLSPVAYVPGVTSWAASDTSDKSL